MRQGSVGFGRVWYGVARLGKVRLVRSWQGLVAPGGAWQGTARNRFLATEATR